MFKIFLPVALLLAFACDRGTPELELWNTERGEFICSFPLKDNSFSLSFFHSVNKSDVEEFYSVRNGEIFLTSCLYATFGAGVASEVVSPQKLTITSDGKMFIEGIDMKIPKLIYVPSVAYDHFLHINGSSHNLTELGLKGKSIEFRIKK